MAHRIQGSTGLLLLVLAVGLAEPAHADADARRTPTKLSYASSQVVVIADAEALEAAPGGALRARNAGFSRVAGEFGLGRAREMGPVRRVGSARRERVWVLTSDRPGFDPVAAAAALRTTGAVRAASPNYRFGLLATYPNDLYLPYQWYIDDGGFADVRLPQAWDIEKGDTSTVIAIMDTGVDVGHPDLASQIWRNAGEIAGNGLDDDGNGLIDDVTGWDFGTDDKDPSPEYTADASGLDVGFHGTFCAGVAAAATNNDDGIAGAGWRCRIMPLKVSHPDSGLYSAAIAGAFVYAVDEGASVISMSFGGRGDPGVPEFFQALVDMATYANVLCVAAAGNDGVDTLVYPAACENVIAVGATDIDNARASFSNWGPWVDVAAPGSVIWSTICRNYEFTPLDQLFYLLFFAWDGVNPYMYGDGTSFACPLTAGVCGLIRSKYPSWPPQMVARHLVATGDAVAFDHPLGVKVNAYRAVSEIPTAVAEWTAAPPVPRVSSAPNPILGSGEIEFTLPRGGRARISMFDVQGRLVRVLADRVFTPGTHRVIWDGGDERGTRLRGAVYFARLEAGSVTASSKVVFVP
ncbi:MAG TPA: S8 family peptidase [Candidatus Eisenbacteria bacterium]|nr:S8 family peptidase [Candidatus Eisenbacteria bacterium]